MIYTEATVFFPLGKLIPEFIATYRARYTDSETGWSAAHWDDTAQTRRRKASLDSGTIIPTPNYDAPLPENPESFTQAWRSEWRQEHQIGHTIALGWPAQFIADLQRDPQPEPELFDGIQVLSAS